MSENLLEEITPKTQSVEAGKALAQFLGLEELPEIIPLADESRLVLSKKRDCYYVATSQGCSCRAGQYGKACRHRSHASSQGMTMAETLEEHDRNLSRMPKSYQRMVLSVREEASGESIYHPGFRPFLEAL